ncbi:MAG: DUF2975 domain-containing protein [Cloacibacterium sp.]|nr:DUF2975 domain-containing protein [Cloacibacterium sp.]
MKNLSNFTFTVLKFFLILTLIGLLVEFWFIIWVWLSHYLNWDGFIRKYHDGIDFTKIWHSNRLAFNLSLLYLLVANILKINLFIAGLKILKLLNLENPFNQKLMFLLKRISILSLIIGTSAILLKTFIELFVNNELVLSTQIGESGYIWFSAIIFIVMKIYEKGVYLQSENDLTI